MSNYLFGRHEKQIRLFFRLRRVQKMEALAIPMAAIAVILVLLLVYVHLENRKYPPGPYGVPLLGYLPFLNKLLYVSLADLSEKYGNVVSVRLGFKTVVVLNDFEAVREALVVQGDTFSGRGMNTRFPEIRHHDVIVSDGKTWKKQKLYVLRTLKALGMGSSSIERDVIDEVEKLTEYLRTKDGQQVDISERLFLPMLNITCKLSYGKIYDSEDKEVRLLKEALYNLDRPSKIVAFLPFLKPLFDDPAAKAVKEILKYVHEEIACQESDPSKTNFTRTYLERISENERVNGVQIAPFTKLNLVGSLLNLLLAGVETTESTLLFSLLYIVHHPEVQTKVQQELDGLMTNDSVLSPNSRSLAPYTHATLMEVHRCASVAPLAIAHRAIRETRLLGHRIAKDTVIVPNLYALHHDQRYWADPSVFRPDRFLDADGQVTSDDHLMPFSAGPRLCLGEPMAKTILFIFFTCLLRRFSFSFVERQPKPSLLPGSSLIVVKPQAFSLVVTCRQ